MKLSKILIITTFHYPHQGGLSSHIDLLKKGYTYHGIESSVLSLSDLPSYVKFIKIIFVSPLYLINKGLAMYCLHALTCFFLKKKIEKCLYQYDALHFHDASLLLKKHFGKKTILTVHADLTNMAIGDGAFKQGSSAAMRFNEIEKLSYKNANCIIAVDERLKQHVMSISGRKDIHKQINFVDTDEFNYTPGIDLEKFKMQYNIPPAHKIIICPRRLVIKNGVIYAAKLLKTLPNEYFLICLGDGPQLSEIQKFAADNHISDRLLILKHITRENMKYFYWIADFVIIPSITVADGMQEATSIAAIEGMAAGKIVLASAIGGLKELIVNNQNGILFTEKDIEALAGLINNLIKDPSLTNKIKAEAKNSVFENFDYRNSVGNIIQYICE